MNILVFTPNIWPLGSGGDLATYLHLKLINDLAPEMNITAVVTQKLESDKWKKLWEGYHIIEIPMRHSKHLWYLNGLYIRSNSTIKKLIKNADLIYIVDFEYLIPFLLPYDKPMVVHFHAHELHCPVATLNYGIDFTACTGCSFKKSVPCIFMGEYEKNSKIPLAFSSAIMNTAYKYLMLKNIERIVKKSSKIRLVFDSHTSRDRMISLLPDIVSKSYAVYNPLPEEKPTKMGNDFGYLASPVFIRGFYVLIKAIQNLKKNGSYTKIKVHATCMEKIIYNNSKIKNILDSLDFILYERLQGLKLNVLFNQLKAVVAPSIYEETFCYNAVEPFLKGKLVIASRSGAIPEVIGDLPGAFLFNPWNVNELEEHIRVIHHMDVDKAYELAIKSRDKLLKKFSPKSTTTRLIDLFTYSFTS